MSNYARYRDWHSWIGLILMVPITVIAATGFLWNHERALGLKHEEHQKEMKSDSPLPVEDRKVDFAAKPGAWSNHSADIDNAIAAARAQWGTEVDLERIELKREHDLGLVVKVKADEESDVRPYEIIWSVADARVIERKGDPKNGTDWAKIVHDLHTGKFFSKRYGFVWSDSGAMAIMALGLTGVVLYTIPVLKKRAKKKAKAAIPTAST